jgi:hypothetical protein
MGRETAALFLSSISHRACTLSYIMVALNKIDACNTANAIVSLHNLFSILACTTSTGSYFFVLLAIPTMES